MSDASSTGNNSEVVVEAFKLDLAAFIQAAADAKNLTYKPTNEELLSLYAHFKQGIVGDNTTDKPGFFDLQGKAKWDAWTKLAGLSKEDAQAKYIEIVKGLQAK